MRSSIEVSGGAQTEWSDEHIAQSMLEGFNSNFGQMAALPALGQEVAIDIRQSESSGETIPWHDTDISREGVGGLRFLRYFFEDKVLHRKVKDYTFGGRKCARFSVLLYPDRILKDPIPEDFGEEISVIDVAKIEGMFLRLWIARDENPGFKFEDVRSRIFLKDHPDKPVDFRKLQELISESDFDVEGKLQEKPVVEKRKIGSYYIRGESDELWGVALDWFLLERNQGSAV